MEAQLQQFEDRGRDRAVALRAILRDDKMVGGAGPREGGACSAARRCSSSSSSAARAADPRGGGTTARPGALPSRRPPSLAACRALTQMNQLLESGDDGTLPLVKPEAGQEPWDSYRNSFTLLMSKGYIRTVESLRNRLMASEWELGLRPIALQARRPAAAGAPPAATAAAAAAWPRLLLLARCMLHRRLLPTSRPTPPRALPQAGVARFEEVVAQEKLPVPFHVIRCGAGERRAARPAVACAPARFSAAGHQPVPAPHQPLGGCAALLTAATPAAPSTRQ